jgi:hypothetical protein
MANTDAVSALMRIMYVATSGGCCAIGR